MCPGRVAARRFGDRQNESGTIPPNVGANLGRRQTANFSKRHSMSRVQLDRPPPPARLAASKRWPVKRRKTAAPETSTLVSAESIRKLFPHPGVDPPAERRASSIFCSFASHALRAYTVGAGFFGRLCSDGGCSHAIATEQSTSGVYERGVYGVLGAELMRRKNAVKMATLTTENYCWILRRRRMTEEEKHAIMARSPTVLYKILMRRPQRIFMYVALQNKCPS